MAVQINEDLWELILRYHLCGDRARDVEVAIEDGLNAKVDAIIKRQTYTKYKSAASPIEREAARQEYLDMIGMFDSFRW